MTTFERLVLVALVMQWFELVAIWWIVHDIKWDMRRKR